MDCQHVQSHPLMLQGLADLFRIKIYIGIIESSSFGKLKYLKKFVMIYVLLLMWKKSGSGLNLQHCLLILINSQLRIQLHIPHQLLSIHWLALVNQLYHYFISSRHPSETQFFDSYTDRVLPFSCWDATSFLSCWTVTFLSY